jgi:hypothetical protein
MFLLTILFIAKLVSKSNILSTSYFIPGTDYAHPENKTTELIHQQQNSEYFYKKKILNSLYNKDISVLTKLDIIEHLQDKIIVPNIYINLEDF